MASSIGVRSLLAARRDIPGPGEHQAQHCQMGQGRGCPAQFCAGATSPRGLGAGWGSIKKALRYWRVSKGGHKVGEGSGEALQGVAEGTWFVQVKGRPHCALNILTQGSGGACTDLFTLITSDRTRGNGRKLSWGVKIRYQEKVFPPEDGWSIQGSGHSIKPARVQEVFRQCSPAHGVILGVSGAGPELDSILTGPFQLKDIL